MTTKRTTKSNLYGRKYNNKKTNGYDSKKEAKRAETLKILEQLGDVTDLREQVVYELIPAQTGIRTVIVNGKPKEKEYTIERKCTYKADFVYVDKTGKTIVEDVKGFRTEVYKIKKKLLLFTHGIELLET